MNSRERMLAALNRELPDRLPVTTHHVLPWFLENTMKGISTQEFFDRFGLDPICWPSPHKAMNAWRLDHERVQYSDSIIQPAIFTSDEWQVSRSQSEDRGFMKESFSIRTPDKILSMSLLNDGKTTWVHEPLIKEKNDIEPFWRYAPVILCDSSAFLEEIGDFHDRGIVRGTIAGFDIYGQPGCFQDAAMLAGTERLMMECLEDPGWVHTFLAIMKSRKEAFIQSLEGLPFDILELGGGTASSTVISPSLFEEFVAPYDAELITLAHSVGQRIVYHTCGGMMPILEMIAAMQPDAMETFTPPDMGGDVNLSMAKKRIGHLACMIGGFDQFHYFIGCSPQETRKAVRQCFEEAGEGGGYILAPSDHFFEADLECLRAFAEEARQCTYS